MTNIFKILVIELRKLRTSVEDKSVEMDGFMGVIRAIKNTPKEDSKAVLNKLEEVKSAQLATNIILKKIEKKEFPKPEKLPAFPEIPKADMSETNELLKQILEKKGEVIDVTLEII